jgi:hypothetical protein
MATLSSSVYDRTLVPEGSTGETLKFYAFNTPIELADGRSWEDDKEKYFQNAMDHFELCCPSLRPVWHMRSRFGATSHSQDGPERRLIRYVRPR